MEQTPRKKQRRGFAAMSDEKRRAIQQRGGLAHAQQIRDMKARLAELEALQAQAQPKAA